MSISDRLDQISARAGAATERPWYAERRNENDPYELTTVYNVFHNGDTADRDLVAEVAYDNAEFIAAARADVPDLVAAVRAVLDMHQPRHEHALAAACSTESCDCEDRCRTVPTEVCGHCIDTGMSAHHYAYEEGGIETVLWPCPTVRAIATALGEDTP